MPSNLLTESLKEEIIEDYRTNKQTLGSLADKYSVSKSSISRLLKGIPKWTKVQINSPNLNEGFFDIIDNESKAYFLGLLISDGNVFNDGSGRQTYTSITLNEKDRYMLDIFKEHIGTNTAINSDGRGCYVVGIRSNRVAKDLEKYGVVSRKSFKTYLPDIPEEMMPHLLRGILDGDGSIRAVQRNIGYAHYISYCGSARLMTDISEYCFRHLDLKVKPLVYTYKNRNLSETRVQNIHDMNLLGKYLYDNATIYLTRKKEKFDSFQEHYNLQ